MTFSGFFYQIFTINAVGSGGCTIQEGLCTIVLYLAKEKNTTVISEFNLKAFIYTADLHMHRRRSFEVFKTKEVP